MTADVQRELAEALEVPRLRGLNTEAVAEILAPTVQALIADAEKRAAAAALREAADWIWDDAPARASASAELHARADELDPS